MSQEPNTIKFKERILKNFGFVQLIIWTEGSTIEHATRLYSQVVICTFFSLHFLLLLQNLTLSSQLLEIFESRERPLSRVGYFSFFY